MIVFPVLLSFFVFFHQLGFWQREGGRFASCMEVGSPVMIQIPPVKQVSDVILILLSSHDADAGRIPKVKSLMDNIIKNADKWCGVSKSHVELKDISEEFLSHSEKVNDGKFMAIVSLVDAIREKERISGDAGLSQSGKLRAEELKELIGDDIESLFDELYFLFGGSERQVDSAVGACFSSKNVDVSLAMDFIHSVIGDGYFGFNYSSRNITYLNVEPFKVKYSEIGYKAEGGDSGVNVSKNGWEVIKFSKLQLLRRLHEISHNSDTFYVAMFSSFVAILRESSPEMGSTPASYKCVEVVPFQQDVVDGVVSSSHGEITFTTKFGTSGSEALPVSFYVGVRLADLVAKMALSDTKQEYSTYIAIDIVSLRVMSWKSAEELGTNVCELMFMCYGGKATSSSTKFIVEDNGSEKWSCELHTENSIKLPVRRSDANIAIILKAAGLFSSSQAARPVWVHVSEHCEAEDSASALNTEYGRIEVNCRYRPSWNQPEPKEL